MRLKNFPTETLALILEFSGTFHAIELWKCGDKHMNLLLAKGGVRKMILVDEDKYSTSRFPTVLATFRSMKNLTIRRNYRLGCPDSIRKHLSLLSDSLESLTLLFDEAAEVIFGSPIPYDQLHHLFDISSEDEWFNQLSETRSSQREPTTTLRLFTKDNFPQLRTLDLQCLGMPESLLEGCCLPSRLTDLTLSCDFNSFPPLQKILPQTLLRLDLGSEEISVYEEDALLQLPAGLTSLECRIRTETPSLMLSIPKALMTLISVANMDLKSLSYHPSLTHVALEGNLRSVSKAGISNLPQTLTNLHLLPHEPFDGNYIRYLPRGLRTLSLPDVEIPKFIQPNDFPKLTKLTIHGMGFHLNNFKNLPESLLTLTIRELCPDAGDTSPELVPLPPRLTSFNIEQQSSTNAIFSMPACVKTVTIPLMVCDDQSLFNAWVGHLPPNLTSMTLSSDILRSDRMKLSDAAVLCLYNGVSKSLTSLDLWAQYFPSKLIQHLPRSLLHLSCLGIGDLLPDEIPGLPPNLSTLHYTCYWNWPVLCERRAHKIAKGLVPGDDREIKELRYRASSPVYIIIRDPLYYKLIPEWISGLPRSLKSVNMSCCALGSDLENLPPSITQFAVDIHLFSIHHRKGLPKTLEMPLRIASIDPEHEQSDPVPISEVDASYSHCPIMHAKIRARNASWSEQHNKPVVSPDPRVAERFKDYYSHSLVT